MLLFSPAMVRALARLFQFKSRADVHLYYVRYRKGGKLLMLFRHPLSRQTQIDLLAELGNMGELVRGNIAVGTHTVSVDWLPLVDSRIGAVYVTSAIQLTVFMTVLGTYEPRLERWHMSLPEASSHIQELSRRHGINWASELGMHST
ncbi:MAG: hypothetical protein V4678_03190 [Patescibacteria group bacterium]